ncbi:MAG TPA: hypothetical protein VLD39_03555 [Gammaproteobacteria bacterium]|nr:hypothetical protein [Gammaproteobacteria bacterium]
MRLATLAMIVVLSPLPAPAQPAIGVATLLHKTADTLGMLRTPREVDRIATLIYSGTGTAIVDGRACRLERYEASVRFPIPGADHPFPVPGMRVDLSCATDAGESERYVEVVAADLAWNETEPGIGAAPAPGTARERLLRIWLLPQGLVKAAAAAGEATAASVDGGLYVLTFPLPAPLDDVIVRATLDPEIFLYHTMPTGLRREFGHRITKVETVLDGRRVEVGYDDYRDWNEPDYKSDVLLPGRIVQVVDGVTTLDLTLDTSNTYNPYVVMPVPESVSTAGAASSVR